MGVWSAVNRKHYSGFSGNFFLSGVGVGKMCVLPPLCRHRRGQIGPAIIAKDFGIPAGRLETAKETRSRESLGA